MTSLKPSGKEHGTSTRVLIATLTLATTAYASAVFISSSWIGGLHPLDILLAAMFAILFGWISISFWISTLGFALALMKGSPGERLKPLERDYKHLPRTAILMPIYNESPVRVFAALRAIYESVQRTGHGSAFDFFVLSDTTEQEIWLQEELHYADLRSKVHGESQIFYRRRHQNLERKSGNIADFCRRWGGGYTYMVVLDADSLMMGTTLIEMVWRMEESPELGILQAPPIPANRGSLFARCQQFAASVHGETFRVGFALWTQTDANYFGHNAIIRIAPFTENAGLPRLPGPEPLGGEILSHDFVEAALMRRAGWKIRLDEDLVGSYEECPTTLVDYAKRDQRWCQGNMQHLRLLFLYGFHPVSRLHLGMGAMSYLSSPLWLLFMLVGWFEAVVRSPGITDLGLHIPALFSLQHSAAIDVTGVIAMLFLPKAWGLLLLYRNPSHLRAHGGGVKASLSVLFEAIISVLVAPVLMAFHAKFVFSTLAGVATRWDVQRRGDSALSLTEAAHAHATQTYVATIATVLCLWLTPNLVWWFVPVLAGLVLSIPISALLASVPVGLGLRRMGLLLIPEETATPQELVDQRRYLDELEDLQHRQPKLDPFEQVVLDPAFNALHIGILQAAQGPAHPAGSTHWRVALTGGSAFLQPKDKLALLEDPGGLRWLHHAAWSQWHLDKLRRAAAILSETDHI